ncbi:fructose-bisphosphatase class II [Salisaeta longa]|uniref:fructose-bisphosphatase class II n=1 Tax=Salisaeta longa TaxID=503170 RepID=UPI0003B479F0|nr:fructose-bisphosphatase class II [Salisaeta longa]
MATERSRFAQRLTEAAACAVYPWIGRGDKIRADRAAVDAMEQVLSSAPYRTCIVVGEGAKDGAPMLPPGACYGPAGGARYDIAVDPLDATTRTAAGADRATTVVAVAPQGTLRDLAAAHYLMKVVGPPALRGCLPLDAPVPVLLRAAADALGRPIAALTLAVQQRPRHADLIQAITQTGAHVRPFDDGEIPLTLDVVTGHGPADLLWGIGGAPEGVLAAAMAQAAGAAFHARLAPQSADEKTRVTEAGYSTGTLRAKDLVRTEDVAVAVSAVTDGPRLRGVRATPEAYVVQTCVLAPGTAKMHETTYSRSSTEGRSSP